MAAASIEVEATAGLRVEEMKKGLEAGQASRDGVFALESEEERERRIRALFESFDDTKCGYLESKQIESGLHSLSFPFQKKYAVELVEACDANHDGRIDFPEFRRYMDTKEAELFSLFEAIDVSHDGALQPEELQTALLNSGYNSPQAHQISCWFLLRISIVSRTHLRSVGTAFFQCLPIGVHWGCALQGCI